MFKPDAEFDAMGDNAHKAAAEQIRAYIERYERLEAEKQDIANQQKEVMAEAKGNGFDVKALRRIIRDRKRDQNDLAEEEAIVDLYKSALGM